MSTFPSCLPCQPCDPRLFALPQTLLLLHEGAQAYGGQTQIIVILVWKNFDVKCQINNVIWNGCGTNWKIMDPILRRKTMPPWRAWTRSCARVSHSIYGSMGLNWCPASDKYILEGRDEVSIYVFANYQFQFSSPRAESARAVTGRRRCPIPSHLKDNSGTSIHLRICWRWIETKLMQSVLWAQQS